MKGYSITYIAAIENVQVSIFNVGFDKTKENKRSAKSFCNKHYRFHFLRTNNKNDKQISYKPLKYSTWHIIQEVSFVLKEEPNFIPT